MIWTPQSKTDLGEEFRTEVRFMMEKVATEHNCNVEELKFSINNLGVGNIQRMTPEEMLKREADRIIEKRVKAIRKAREV